MLDRLDRYQTVAAANQVYDEEARAKLLAKINRVAANLGIDEVMYAAGREHLRKIGEIRDKPGGESGRGTGGRRERRSGGGGRAARGVGRVRAFFAQPRRRVQGGGNFFHFFRP